MPPIVVVAGISGVGKSWMLNRAFESEDIQVLSASELISAEIRKNTELDPVSQDQMRERDIQANQRFLLNGLASSIDPTASLVILDAHVAIDTSEGLTLIPVEVFERIGPDSIVFVSGDAETICEQRSEDSTRLRPRRSPTELGRQQTTARDWAKELASRLGISFKTIEASEIGALKDTLNDLQGKF